MNSGCILSIRARSALIIPVVILTMMVARTVSGSRAPYQTPNPCAAPSFALPAPLLPTPGLSILTAGDFNNDGRHDLVTLAYVEQYVLSFAAGNSAGVFDPPRAGTLGFAPRARMALKAADFNNDGKLDLLFIDGAAGHVYVRLGDGAGGFAAPLPSNVADTFIAADSPAQTVIADLNKDRNLDIIVTAVFTAQVYVLLGAGEGRFNAPLSFVPTLTATTARALGWPCRAAWPGAAK